MECVNFWYNIKLSELSATVGDFSLGGNQISKLISF
jgi:hypothetical protein